MTKITSFLFCLLIASTQAIGQEAAEQRADSSIVDESSQAPPGSEEEIDEEAILQMLRDRLNYQTGTIVIGSNLATLNLPTDLRFLDAEGAKFVVEEIWGNPPGDEYLGLVLPSDLEPWEEECVAAIITYEDTGHISDDDATSIDYAQLLKEMQAGEAAENAERAKLGFETVHVVGWAKEPSYDSVGKKLYWAKAIEFGGGPDRVLNYAIRVLGRTGVLQFNFVGTMDQLAIADEMTPRVLNATSFNEGNRYADFDPSTDHVAEYGIAALIAGGVAAKAGLFKGIWLAILAFKKFIIVGVIAIGAFLARLLGRKSEPTPEDG